MVLEANIQSTTLNNEDNEHMKCHAQHTPFLFFTYLQFYILTYQYIFYLYNYKIISNYRVVVPLNPLEHTFL